MALKENSKIVFNFVKAHDGEDFTAQDIADATGLSVRVVNGIVTSAFQRHKNRYKVILVAQSLGYWYLTKTK